MSRGSKLNDNDGLSKGEVRQKDWRRVRGNNESERRVKKRKKTEICLYRRVYTTELFPSPIQTISII